MSGRFVRLAEKGRETVPFTVDGRRAVGLAGDTLLVALLNEVGHLRRSEFGDGNRAGFCLMGACQDCWLWTEDGERLRACTTTVAVGMRILTDLPEGSWPKPA
jgi:hypothetical protein